MIAERMKPLMANNSAIRTMFEEGGKLKAKYGAENVFDFSLGNPDAPVPGEIKQAILDILEEEVEKQVTKGDNFYLYQVYQDAYCHQKELLKYLV